jgi:UDP-N-acetylglucosamine/UDP-N-acetylgalactosamine diphosphorylase
MTDKKPKAANAKKQAIIDRVFKEGQGHVFRFWSELDEARRDSLIAQCAAIDFDVINRLIAEYVKGKAATASKKIIEPAPILPLASTDAQKKEAAKARKAGEELLQVGKVASFLVAGGQSTRLGYDRPKGTFPITPVKNKTLFQLHAEKTIAASRRYGKGLPWYIMTSVANHKQTTDFFEENKYFGLPKDDVRFFQQDMIPAVDMDGKFILETKDHIFTNPNGHGGSLLALKKSGALDDMKKRGIEEIFYYQVDNVLATICDPLFIGYHHLAKADMSTKVVSKAHPEEKVGITAIVNGKLGIIEYSDLSKEQMHETNKDGSLKFDGGNTAIHMLRVAFVERMNKGGLRLPYHKAVKHVAGIDAKGKLIPADAKNGVKFETFVFDALGEAANSVTMQVKREDEFSPVKNAKGEDSPATARKHLIEMWSRWMRAAGMELPKGANFAVEISPLTALDQEELIAKAKIGFSFSWELYI